MSALAQVSPRSKLALALGLAGVGLVFVASPASEAWPALWRFQSAPWAWLLALAGWLGTLWALVRRPEGPRGRPALDRRRIWALDLAVFVLGTALCLRFADTARGGDFERVVFDITHGVWILKAEPLSPWMLGRIAAAAAALGLEPLFGLRLGLALWGGLGFVALRHLAWALARDAPSRGALAFVALAGAGSSALLFAHVETYTFAAVCMIFALAFALRTSRDPRWALPSVLAYVAACSFHLQMLCLGPAILWAVWPQLRAGGRAARGLWLAAGAGLAWLALLQLWAAQNPAPYPQFFGGGDGRMLVAGAQLVSKAHLLDVLNELALVGLGGALVGMALLADPRSWSRPTQVAAVAALGWTLFATLWNPDLGAWRDWDLFAAWGWWLVSFAVAASLDDDAPPQRAWLCLLVAGLGWARTLPFVLDNHHAAL